MCRMVLRHSIQTCWRLPGKIPVLNVSIVENGILLNNCTPLILNQWKKNKIDQQGILFIPEKYSRYKFWRSEIVSLSIRYDGGRTLWCGDIVTNKTDDASLMSRLGCSWLSFVPVIPFIHSIPFHSIPGWGGGVGLCWLKAFQSVRVWPFHSAIDFDFFHSSVDLRCSESIDPRYSDIARCTRICI